MFRRIDTMSPATGQDSALLSMGDLSIDTLKRKVTLRDKQVNLTAREFDLLAHFAASPGRVYTRGQLLDQVWGYGYEGYEHTVNSHINMLLGKIEEDPAHPRYILTVWGVGYRFTEA
jgi:DNA-binding response OmpR family regulator